MKLNLNCFLTRDNSPQKPNVPQSKPLSLAEFQNSRPFHKPVETSWVSLGVPAAIHEPPGGSRLSSFTANVSSSGSCLPDKIRHLGEILKSLDAQVPTSSSSTSEFEPSKQAVSTGVPYRRNWLETDYPLLKEPIVETPRQGSQSSSRLCSVRTTPRENNVNVVEKGSATGFDLQMQLTKLEEMLKEERPGKEQHVEHTKSLEMDVLKDVLVRLGRVETLSRRIRPASREDCQHKVLRTRMKHTTPVKRSEKTFRSFMSNIKDHMGRVDAAVRKVEKELQKLTSTRKKARTEPDMPTSCNNSSFGGPDFLFQPDNFSSSALEQRLLKVQTELQRMMLMSTEEVRRQCEENKTDIKLCWSAMNQLCIDNEAFRQELLQLKTLAFKTSPKDEHFQDLETKTTSESLQENSQCGRWSCTSSLH